MKASELISNLISAIAKEGDIEIAFLDSTRVSRKFEVLIPSDFIHDAKCGNPQNNLDNCITIDTDPII